jgi:hypothetical protein
MIWNIIGPLGDCPIQAATPQLAASLYPTFKGYKSSIRLEYIVTCHETGERFRVKPVTKHEVERIN